MRSIKIWNLMPLLSIVLTGILFLFIGDFHLEFIDQVITGLIAFLMLLSVIAVYLHGRNYFYVFGFPLIALLLLWLAVNLQNNPLFLEDLVSAFLDVQVEIAITYLFAITLTLVAIYIFDRYEPKVVQEARPKVKMVSKPQNLRTKLSEQRKRARDNAPSGKQSMLPLTKYSLSHMNDKKQEWRSNFWQGVSTELIGAVVTTVTLSLFVLIFQQYQSMQNRKAELILQMGSPNRLFAIEAVRQLDSLGWLHNGTLQGAMLFGANLTDVNLLGAHLTNTSLYGANLTNASLVATNLTNADLEDANLTGASILSSNLNDANLEDTTLIGVDLTDANLLDTNLTDASLAGAILPDGTQWTPETDMERFTNSFHTDFWDPCVELDETPWYCN